MSTLPSVITIITYDKTGIYQWRAAALAPVYSNVACYNSIKVGLKQFTDL